MHTLTPHQGRAQILIADFCARPIKGDGNALVNRILKADDDLVDRPVVMPYVETWTRRVGRVRDLVM